jgi:predicted nuclease of restriction endonuclease-like (RecB) superfamily
MFGYMKNYWNDHKNNWFFIDLIFLAVRNSKFLTFYLKVLTAEKTNFLARGPEFLLHKPM